MAKKGSAGGKATAKKLRSISVERYYDNPNFCAQCLSVIEIAGRKVSDVRRLRFCNKSCAATNRNLSVKRKKKCVKCEFCVEGEVPRYDSGAIRSVKKCLKCLPYKGKDPMLWDLVGKTKGSYFSESANWQSARSTISKHARKVYAHSVGDYSCFICSYDKHVDICHKKPVSDFKDDATIREVNAVINLVALCKNHHWELDNGHLLLE